MSNPVEAAQAAAKRLRKLTGPTSLDHAPHASAKLGNNIYLKREDLMPVHSFKLRGAYNRMVQLSPAEKKRGVIAASAGNHAQGVALSGRELGIKTVIVMPTTTPDIKVNAVRSFGGEVIQFGDNFSEAFEHCQSLIKSSGMVFVHPFDDQDVIDGQATVGLELLDQLPELDYIFVPVGGGGLAAGVAGYAKSVKPEIKVIGVEPVDSDTMRRSIASGKPYLLDHVGIFADGVAVKQAGERTFELCQRYLDDTITVTTDQMCAAIKTIYEDTRAIVEPAGALSLAGAAVYLAKHTVQGATVATVCSGANMSFEKLQFVAERTLLGSGLEALFAVRLPEQAGALRALCDQVVDGHNITEFCYRLQRRERADILIGFKMSGPDETADFAAKLNRHGYDNRDVSNDEVAKEHIRHMIGGLGSSARHELLYEVNFPERPGALTSFLHGIGDSHNISLFHYRGQGGDIGRVLIGFEAPDRAGLERAIMKSGYEFRAVDSPAAATFLQDKE